MRRGKEAAQASHSSMAFITRQLFARRFSLWSRLLRLLFGDRIQLSAVQRKWINSHFTKVCVQVNSEEELLDVAQKAQEAGIVCHVVTDKGLTEFNGIPTKTCLALGPDLAEKLDPITGNLKLY